MSTSETKIIQFPRVVEHDNEKILINWITEFIRSNWHKSPENISKEIILGLKSENWLNLE